MEYSAYTHELSKCFRCAILIAITVSKHFGIEHPRTDLLRYSAFILASSSTKIQKYCFAVPALRCKIESSYFWLRFHDCYCIAHKYSKIIYWAQMCYHLTYLNALFGSSCNKSACWLRAQTNVHERFAWSIRTLNIVDVFANVSLSLVAFRELVKFTISCNWLNTKKIRRSKNTTNFFGIILATNWVGSKFRKMKKRSKLNSSSNHTKQT